ncbi:MAG TPA: O-antigen ligase family protein [Candidatus Eisenbacteria bacterium]
MSPAPASAHGSHGRAVAVLFGLAATLAGGVFVCPLAGIVAAGLTGALTLRPLEPITAVAVMAGAASFVSNEGGHLTRELSLVSITVVYALVSLALARARGRWRAPGGPLVVALGAFLAWTAICAIRGALAGYTWRYAGLELVALTMMAFAWGIGGLRLEAADLRPARTIMVLFGLGHVGLGIWSYAVNHIRTGGVWYIPLPGMLAVMALAFALHAHRRRVRFGWTVLMGLFLLHQTISFSRGYWLGLMAALPWTAFTYAGFGRGAAARWRRAGGIAVLAFSLAAATTVATSLAYGWSDLPQMLGTRFRSIGSMRNSSESASNMERLLEYAYSFRLIRETPWFGRGMGYELRIRNPIYHVVTRQWFVHHTYLWIWLKQGLVGLVLLLVLLWQAWRVGLRGARAPDGEGAAWCLTAAGATLFLSVVDLTTFHLAQVDATTFQTLLWGFALALSRPAHLRLVWRASPRALAAGSALPSPGGGGVTG